MDGFDAGWRNLFVHPMRDKNLSKKFILRFLSHSIMNNALR